MKKQTQRCKLLHIGKTHDQHLEASCVKLGSHLEKDQILCLRNETVCFED